MSVAGSDSDVNLAANRVGDLYFAQEHEQNEYYLALNFMLSSQNAFEHTMVLCRSIGGLNGRNHIRINKHANGLDLKQVHGNPING